MKWLLLIVLLFLAGCDCDIVAGLVGTHQNIPAGKIDEYDHMCRNHSGAWFVNRRGTVSELVCQDHTVITL